MFRKFLLTAAAAVAVAVLAPATSQAQFTVTLSAYDATTNSVDTATFTVTGNSVSVSSNNGTLNTGYLDVASTTSLIIGGLSFDGYSVSLTGTSSNFPGSSTEATLNITAFAITNNTGSTASPFTVSISESNFSQPSSGSAFLASQTAVTNLQAGSQTSVTGSTSYTSSAPTPVAASTPGETLNYSNYDQNPYVYSNSFTINGTYTLADNLSIASLAATQTVQITEAGELLATPAPSALILAATIVPFFGLLRRRVREMNAAIVA